MISKTIKKKNPKTIDDCDYDEKKCWLSKKDFRSTNCWSKSEKTRRHHVICK